ncbi:hypothetical protein [Amycolatopsis sp. FDAARGOS 1241]|uniref:hypothetical protein n=1 Tax=Amycolatopsis sp. FDAARGOS 1241 TaxID=2778070 RepID=UPI00351BF4DA
MPSSRTAALKLGDELTSPSRLETVSAHIGDALVKGACALTGGRARPDLGPLFHDPTVLTDVTPDVLLHLRQRRRVDGRKDSGVGRRNGAEGLLNYTEAPSIAGRRGLALRPRAACRAACGRG